MKHFYLKSGVLMLIYALWIQLASAQQTTQPLINSTLHGTVLDAATKRPLPGATLAINGTTHSVSADANGKFSFITGQKFPYTLTYHLYRLRKARGSCQWQPHHHLLERRY